MKLSKFEAWLYDNQPLSPEAELELRNAMVVSPELREQAEGWRTVRADLENAEFVGPPVGFTYRWRARLIRHQASHRQRQVKLALGATLAGAFGSLGLLVMLLLISPAGLAVAWMETAIQIGRSLEAAVRLGDSLIDGMPLAAGALLFGVTLAWLSAIWFASLYRFAFQTLQNGERK
jgi:hypothetical protein